MFANAQTMGVGLAFPDVCKTPPALPIPYPNFALGPTALPNAWNILYSGTPVHNMATTTPITNGDNAGVLMGVVLQTVMGPSPYHRRLHRAAEGHALHPHDQPCRAKPLQHRRYANGAESVQGAGVGTLRHRLRPRSEPKGRDAFPMR
ncbi:hypothetical protein J2W23_001622 [Variovorax boronicumulans]|nr:hypothetical protein [Variovorax boronicumulans]